MFCSTGMFADTISHFHLICDLRCLDDVDDEVRDRAAMYLRLFGETSLAATYVKEGNAYMEACLIAQFELTCPLRIHLLAVCSRVKISLVHQ